MSKTSRATFLLLVVSALLGAVLLASNRNQTLIDDSRFMKAMIPHHSIVINNARKSEHQ